MIDAFAIIMYFGLRLLEPLHRDSTIKGNKEKSFVLLFFKEGERDVGSSEKLVKVFSNSSRYHEAL